MKTFGMVSVVLILLAAGVWAAAQWWASSAQAVLDQPTKVRIEPAAVESLVETISATGEVDARIKVQISARVSARITALPYKIGDRVTKGDPAAAEPVLPSVLVQLDSKDLEAALKSVEARHAAETASLEVSRSRLTSSEARLQSSRIMLADAERELARRKQLLSSRDVSQSEFDQLQAKVEQQQNELAAARAALEADRGQLVVLKHQIEAAEAEIAKARDNLAYATITSPIDGVVTRLNAEAGEVVMTGTMNNAGTIIMEVADLSQMVLKAWVDESAIAAVNKGQTAKVRMETYRGTVFDGVVQSVALANYDASTARGASRSTSGRQDMGKVFEVSILIDTQNHRFFSGLSADAEIETKRHENVVKVPSQAVLARAPGALPNRLQHSPEVDMTKSVVPVVYRYLDGKAVATPVKIGASDMTHTVIESGLAHGEAIIVGPYKVLEGLADDQKVSPDGAAIAVTQPSTTQASPASQPDAR